MSNNITDDHSINITLPEDKLDFYKIALEEAASGQKQSVSGFIMDALDTRIKSKGYWRSSKKKAKQITYLKGIRKKFEKAKT